MNSTFLFLWGWLCFALFYSGIFNNTFVCSQNLIYILFILQPFYIIATFILPCLLQTLHYKFSLSPSSLWPLFLQIVITWINVFVQKCIVLNKPWWWHILLYICFQSWPFDTELPIGLLFHKVILAQILDVWALRLVRLSGCISDITKRHNLPMNSLILWPLQSFYSVFCNVSWVYV